MASPAPSFLRLANTQRLLALRSDVDSIILELLGVFSLEKIYAEGDRKTYQQLLTTLLAQLNAIFHIQRLSLPSENSQIGWYLRFIASWEVTLRSIDFVLQTVVEGRESLWDAQTLRDKYLAEFLLSALRVLTLHPKVPANQRAKDRRDRFARINRSLELVFDSYPGKNSFLLFVCKEVTESLRTDPDSLILPPGLRNELPNLASELYPLANCLTSQQITALVPADGFPGNWLSQFLALRDISHFVVAASIQYVVNRETRDMHLQATSARSRNAVIHALENVHLPNHLSKVDLSSTFSEIFRIILPDTPRLGRRTSSESHNDEIEMDALDALCSRLSDRQLVHRVSDREMMHNVSELARNLALLDDPGGKFRGQRPTRLYAFNCEKCHLAGDSQLRNLGLDLPSDVGENSEINLPSEFTCTTCGNSVTMVRELSIVRHAWESLKPIQLDAADTINVERHISNLFELYPKNNDGGEFDHSYSSVASGSQYGSLSPRESPQRSRSFPQTLVSPISPGFTSIPDPPRVGLPDTSETKEAIVDTGTQQSDVPCSPGLIGSPVSTQSQDYLEPVTPAVSFESISPARSRKPPLATPLEKGKYRWKRFGSRKESAGTSGDTSLLPPVTSEPQLEEISLKALIGVPKKNAKLKGSRSINVMLSQNSTYSLFWTSTSIYLWDVGTSPPTLSRTLSTESTCVLAAATKVHLAYIMGTRDQKLTLRIVNLVQPSVNTVEYRIPSSWPRSMAVCPKENYVVVGFDNSLVRFYSTTLGEDPREDHLHIRYHPECKECQPVDNLSFSNDGLVLLGSTRSAKSGMIQVYSWNFPFLTFEEVSTCRYHVALHESEDGGCTSAIFRPGQSGEGDLICMTTWTQSGPPCLIQPEDGHRTEIRTENNVRQNKLGSRIQCAAFSPSGTTLALVNDKGDLYKLSSLNSNPLDIKKVGTSKELTAKSESFAMTFMTLPNEDAIVMAWAEVTKGMGYIKKIPTSSSASGTLNSPPILGISQTPTTPHFELPGDSPQQPVELVSPDTPSTFVGMKAFGLNNDDSF